MSGLGLKLQEGALVTLQVHYNDVSTVVSFRFRLLPSFRLTDPGDRRSVSVLRPRPSKQLHRPVQPELPQGCYSRSRAVGFGPICSCEFVTAQ
jgi:hypothetical protein